jgi:general secretion pathway protein G
MLAAPLTLSPNRRRSAFTLLEVLVVVAILVVLASVASIAVFKYLDDAKEDKAILDMQAIDRAYQSFCLKNGVDAGTEINLDELAPLLEQGSQSLFDPWQQKYAMTPQQGENGQMRAQFHTTNPKNQKQLFWPRK